MRTGKCSLNWVMVLLVGTILAWSARATAQVTVVDMVPTSNSGETSRDAEPNLAIDPSAPLTLAASAFTPDPNGTLSGVLYFSTDGGQTWNLTNAFIPASATLGCVTTYCDITLRFSPSSHTLYASFLVVNGSGNTDLSIGAIANVSTNARTFTSLQTSAGTSAGFADQPWVEAGTVQPNDHAYVDYNDIRLTNNTATMNRSLNPVPPPPSGFNATVIDTTNTCSQDAPSVRPAVHQSGIVYATFYRWTGSCSTADIIVVRDDNWGTGPNAFQALQDSVTHTIGQRVAIGITLGSGSLGNQRVGSQLAIAVDPNNNQNVYVAWGDGSPYTLHVRHSTDGGQTWSSDLRTISNATNPGLAINNQGKVAFLYQALVNPGSGNRWRTHLERTTNAFTSVQDLILADVPDQSGSYAGSNPIGDYDNVIAQGGDFYGVFSAFNTADNANFPNGVSYLRYADFNLHRLYADAAHTITVNDSIDPYFFHVSELASTNLTYQGDTSSDYHDPAHLAALLVNQTNGQPISGASVQFTLGAQSCAGSTSLAGIASCTLVPNQPAGSYTVKADFAGSALYLPSSDSAPFTITLEETTLTYTGDTVIANAGTATMSGVLLEDNTTPIAGRMVSFTLGTGGSAQTCSGVTNTSGLATCPISPVAQPLGPGVVGDSFAGDAFYRPASSSANTSLFAFLTSGAFTVGDQSAQTGAQVTFWGSQWPQSNSLSGGAAPSSFKGFAATLSAEPPKCKITWTTGPGASSNPPATVPAYMGVLVASKVEQSGSTISGDAKRIVVVKADAGYSPNPGHPGTGTIVADFCHP
jgi:hypothetical protein